MSTNESPSNDLRYKKYLNECENKYRLGTLIRTFPNLQDISQVPQMLELNSKHLFVNRSAELSIVPIFSEEYHHHSLSPNDRKLNINVLNP